MTFTDLNDANIELAYNSTALYVDEYSLTLEYSYSPIYLHLIQLKLPYIQSL